MMTLNFTNLSKKYYYLPLPNFDPNIKTNNYYLFALYTYNLKENIKILIN